MARLWARPSQVRPQGTHRADKGGPPPRGLAESCGQGPGINTSRGRGNGQVQGLQCALLLRCEPPARASAVQPGSCLCTAARPGHELRCVCAKGQGLYSFVKTGEKGFPAASGSARGRLGPPRVRSREQRRAGRQVGVGALRSRITRPTDPGRTRSAPRAPHGTQNCVSSRVSGLQEASLLLQLLFRLWELLATWARGSERIRYLRGGREVPDVSLRLGGWAGRARVRWAGVQTRPGARYLHDVVGLQPRVRRGVDEHIGEGVLLVVYLVCGDRAQRAVTTRHPLHLRSGGPRGAGSSGPAAESFQPLCLSPRPGEPSRAGPP